MSDECSAEAGKGDRESYCFRLNAKGEKWKKQYIKPYKKGKGISVMIWAAIWGENKSDLTVLSRDWESKKQGYSANSYLEVLEDNLYSIWEPGLEFMQDNAPIHTANKIKKWFENNGIKVMPWPPYSPDMNAIENLWARLKELMYEANPDLGSLTGSEEDIRAAIIKALENAWERIDKEYIVGLIKSMDNRINALLEAKGWYTRY